MISNLSDLLNVLKFMGPVPPQDGIYSWTQKWQCGTSGTHIHHVNDVPFHDSLAQHYLIPRPKNKKFSLHFPSLKFLLSLQEFRHRSILFRNPGVRLNFRPVSLNRVSTQKYRSRHKLNTRITCPKPQSPRQLLTPSSFRGLGRTTKERNYVSTTHLMSFHTSKTWTEIFHHRRNLFTISDLNWTKNKTLL